MISIAVTKNGIDGTDVRLLKLLAEKFDFAYNITIPDSFNAAIRMVCNLNFFLHIIVVSIFSVQQPRGRFILDKSNIQI